MDFRVTVSGGGRVDRQVGTVDERCDLRALMAGYQRGEPDAFDQLYRRLAPAVRRRLATLTRDASWLDDLLQETFLQLHRARCVYDPDRPVQPWALAIAQNVFLMSRRARVRRRDFSPGDEEDLGQLDAPGHEHACLLKDQLVRSLAVLTPGTRRAVVLHHGVGLSLEEVARVLGITHRAAKLRVGRGVARARGERASRRARERAGSGHAPGARFSGGAQDSGAYSSR